MKQSNYEMLKRQTKNTALLWDNVHGIATEATASKLDLAMLDWQYDLTETLKIWIDKGLAMQSGELILACANLGALVESWLKFFYSVYYEEYSKNPIRLKGVMVEPEKAKFEDLKNFSTGILWKSAKSTAYKWVDAVQKKRNAIHSFCYRDIGTPQEFLTDIDCLLKFVENIISHLPPIEDCIESYSD